MEHLTEHIWILKMDFIDYSNRHLHYQIYFVFLLNRTELLGVFVVMNANEFKYILLYKRYILFLSIWNIID